MPNGLDPHEWEPSARDVETLNKASLIVRNGLGLEGGLEKTLQRAADAGVPVFTASDHITVRHVQAGEGIPGDADQTEGAADPHLWLDPLRMKSVILALADELRARFGTNLSVRAADLAKRLDRLDADLKEEAMLIPAENRLLVTGHESLGYFAQAYGFRLVGAVIPSLSTRAEVSASDLAALKKQLMGLPVKIIFTEMGTPPKVAQVLANELHLETLPIATHLLPEDGSYFTFMHSLMGAMLLVL
jgi:zinc/manganese transport system substrate-binding protein